MMGKDFRIIRLSDRVPGVSFPMVLAEHIVQFTLLQMTIVDASCKQ